MTVTQDQITPTVAPTGSAITAARVYWAIVATIGTASFIVSCGLAVTQEDNGGWLNGLVFTLSYFTVWSNILTFIMNWSLAVDPTRDGQIFRWLRMTSLVMITITGLVYAIVLAADANPVGLGVYTNIGYHYISPWATVLGFLLFGPRPRFRLKTVFYMLAIPTLWLIYTLLRGLMLTTPPPQAPATELGAPQNWYPYPFIDVNDPSPLIPGLEFGGYAGVGANIVVIIILGLVFGFIFLGLDRALSRGRKALPLG